MKFRMLFTPYEPLKRRCATPIFDENIGGIRTGKRQHKRSTKKYIFCIITTLCIAFALFIPIFCNIRPAYADDGKSKEEIESQLADSVKDLIDRLGTDELDKFLESLGDESSEALKMDNIKRALAQLVNGEHSDFFSGFLNVLGSTVGKYFAGFLPSFITVIIICLLNSLLGGLTGDFLGGSTREIVHVVCYSAIIIVLMTGIVGIIREVSGTVDALSRLSAALFPILLTLLSMLGGSATAAMYTPYMAALSAVIMKIVTVAVIPAFIAAIVFSVVGNISKTISLDKLTKLIRSASSWLIGIVFGLFATFLTVQGVAGGVADKFGFNIAKFALSSYVPILGGYLSDGIDLLSASVMLIKNAVGYTGVLLLLAAVLFPIARVIIFTLTLRLTAAIAEPVGDSRVASLLSTIAGNMNLLITALAGVAFLFFILLMLLIGTANYGI